MQKQSIQIVIAKDGTYTFEAKEGIKGQNCREITKEIEVAIGGVVDKTSNKSEYYDDSDDNFKISLDI